MKRYSIKVKVRTGKVAQVIIETLNTTSAIQLAELIYGDNVVSRPVEVS